MPGSAKSSGTRRRRFSLHLPLIAHTSVMEREVRYCTTDDGVRIAYCVEGEGATTILALPVFNETFSLDHLMPVYQQFYRDLGAGRRVIRFDWRGTGLSGDMAQGIESGRYHVADLEAVARAAGQPCVTWASTTAGPAAIEFAVAHPEVVSHLILYGTYAVSSDAFSQDFRDGFASLARANWQMAAQTIADLNGRREFPAEAGQLGEWFYRSEAAEAYVARGTTPRFDVSSLLSQVEVPTLVLHRIADPAFPIAAGQKLAAGIPGARFVTLEGKGNLFCLGDYSKILSSVDAFVGDRAPAAERAPAAAGRAQESGVRTVLFTDIVGHTEMMQRLGDAKGRDVLREHERITRETLKQHAGAEVKTDGDSFMASFASVSAAVECAVALQRAFAEHSKTADEPILVRMGLHAGEPLAENGDLFGSSVIMASRIEAQAAGGEILVSDVVRSLLSGKGFTFADRGEFAMKGFDDAVRLYEARWRP
jgi:class 3 adenylate cyclase